MRWSRNIPGEVGRDRFAGTVADPSDMYDPAAGDIIRLSAQAFMTGNHLEQTMGTKLSIHKDAALFPVMLKNMTSAAAYVYLLSFPAQISSSSYLQFFPDATVVHNMTANIMSFDKEILDGESNQILQLPEQHGVPAVDMLDRLVETM